MNKLYKRLSKLSDLLKALKAPIIPKATTIPGIKPITPPSMTPKTSIAPKIGIGAGPDSKKDPKAVAQQIKDGSMSTKTQKVMLKAQWTSEDIEKADNEAKQGLFHVHQGPHRITSEPLTMPQIIKRHGGVQHLENNGFRLHPVKPTIITPTPPIKKTESDKLLEPTDPSSI